MNDTASPSSASSIAKRRKFLVIVDETPECEVAIQFASLRAKHTNGTVTLLHVIEPSDQQQWLGVQNIMREEARAEAESVLHRLAAQVNEYSGSTPELIIREGHRAEQMKQLIQEDPGIAILVLASSTGKEGPGPLVTLIARGADSGISIPVTIVPGDLTEEAIQALA